MASNKKWELNERAFDFIDNPDSCYWLGVITADGWVSGNRIGLEVSVRDHGWLEQFKSFLSYEGPINVYPPSRSGRGNGGDRSRLRFSSPYMVDRLKQLGLDNQKTLTADFCTVIPVNNIRHYIRGLTDGDGHLSYNEVYGWQWGLSGTNALLKATKQYLLGSLATDLYLYPDKNCNIYRLRSKDSEGALRVSGHLYRPEFVALERKKKIACSIIG